MYISAGGRNNIFFSILQLDSFRKIPIKFQLNLSIRIGGVLVKRFWGLSYSQNVSNFLANTILYLLCSYRMLCFFNCCAVCSSKLILYVGGASVAQHFFQHNSIFHKQNYMNKRDIDKIFLRMKG